MDKNARSIKATELEREVRLLKRVASEYAGLLHDLVEERLPTAFEELPKLSNQTYEACQA